MPGRSPRCIFCSRSFCTLIPFSGIASSLSASPSSTVHAVVVVLFVGASPLPPSARRSHSPLLSATVLFPRPLVCLRLPLTDDDTGHLDDDGAELSVAAEPFLVEWKVAKTRPKQGPRVALSTGCRVGRQAQMMPTLSSTCVQSM